MPKSVKRSKSNGLKSRKRPGKKSGNAKKMRKTRKNKGGSMTSVMCKTIVWTISFAGLAGSVLSWDPRGFNNWAQCDKKKQYQSLTEIKLAKDIIKGDFYNKMNEYKYDISEIELVDTYTDMGTKKFNLLHIKKNTGFIANRDQYYLYDTGNKIDTFRSIAFTYMNKYVSKYVTFRKRKFHILKLLLELNPEDLLNESINNIDDENLKAQLNNFRDNYIYIFTSFKNAAEYVCKNNKNLKKTCDDFALNNSISGEEIKGSVKELLLIPIVEYEKFTENGVYPISMPKPNTAMPEPNTETGSTNKN